MRGFFQTAARPCSVLIRRFYGTHINAQKVDNVLAIGTSAVICCLRHGGYVSFLIVVVVCLLICLLATLRKNVQTDLHEI